MITPYLSKSRYFVLGLDLLIFFILKNKYLFDATLIIIIFQGRKIEPEGMVETIFTYNLA